MRLCIKKYCRYGLHFLIEDLIWKLSGIYIGESLFHFCELGR